MGFLDFLFNRKPLTREDLLERKKIVESKRDAAANKLAQEKAKPNPDVLKIDRYGRELAIWEAQLKKTDERMQMM